MVIPFAGLAISCYDNINAYEAAFYAASDLREFLYVDEHTRFSKEDSEKEFLGKVLLHESIAEKYLFLVIKIIDSHYKSNKIKNKYIYEKVKKAYDAYMSKCEKK